MEAVRRGVSRGIPELLRGAVRGGRERHLVPLDLPEKLACATVIYKYINEIVHCRCKYTLSHL